MDRFIKGRKCTGGIYEYNHSLKANTKMCGQIMATVGNECSFCLFLSLSSPPLLFFPLPIGGQSWRMGVQKLTQLSTESSLPHVICSCSDDSVGRKMISFIQVISLSPPSPPPTAALHNSLRVQNSNYKKAFYQISQNSPPLPLFPFLQPTRHDRATRRLGLGWRKQIPTSVPGPAAAHTKCMSLSVRGETRR